MFNLKYQWLMLEYFKVILAKVSFDKVLFEKELIKALKNLMINEVKELKQWCTSKFNAKYSDIIDRCFGKFSKQLNLSI